MGRPRLKQLSGQGASDNQVATYDSVSAQWGAENTQGEETILSCETVVAVREPIYIDISTGEAKQANATSMSTAPVFGLVVSKPTTITCKVVQLGLVTGFSALTPGNQLYLGTTAGGLVSTAPTGSGNVFQKIGKVISATSVLVKIEDAIERGVV